MRLLRQTYTQDPHCCLDENETPTLDVEILDGGGGQYLVVTAAHWALDSQEEVDALFHLLTLMMEGVLNAPSRTD